MKNSALMPWRAKTDDDNGFVQLQQAMNDVFGNFATVPEWTAPAFWSGSKTWNPRLDIAETEKEVTVYVELPGLEEKDVDVSLMNDLLVIKGEKRADRDEKGKTFHRIERNYGAFQRMLELPFDVDRNAIKATFAKGVLTVSLPKTEKARQAVCKIPVKPS